MQSTVVSSSQKVSPAYQNESSPVSPPAPPPMLGKEATLEPSPVETGFDSLEAPVLVEVVGAKAVADGDVDLVSSRRVNGYDSLYSVRN